MPPALINDHTARVLPCAYPLDDFYAEAGRALPDIQPIDGPEVPEPFRSLLVHDADMTPTLERFHGRAVHLEVLHRRQRDDSYYREVVLLLDGTEQAVEFGAIKIHLALFPPAARQAILGEREPLGHVLAQHGIRHTSRPKAFLKIQADDFICRALRLPAPAVLYGRRNTLFDPQHRPLAEIVEILPPATPKKA